MSDAELLAILLGSGRQGQNVVEIAHDLLARTGDLRALAESAEAELCALPGVGPARAAVIQAAVELGRRVTGSRPERGRFLGNAADVWTHYRARLEASPVEEFWMLALDVRHRVLLESCVARGSLTGVEVHPRDVFRTLIRSAAADHTEVRDIREVVVRQDSGSESLLMFDRDHSWEERILAEQFQT